MELINRILYNMTEVHPFHPLVVHFPIALTGAALFFILLAMWRRKDEFERIAFANISLASISALAAGITGLMDNQSTYDGEAPNASAKIALASVLLVLTAVIAVARWRNPNLFHSRKRLLYVGGYFASFGLVAVLGFLGGIILYGFQVVPADAATGGGIGQESRPSSVSVALAVSPTATLTIIPGVSFSNDVLPIFKSRCINCHGGKKTEEGLDLTGYAMLMAGSENGPVVLPGDILKSLLAQALIEREMPKRGPKLTPNEAQLILDWIMQGALDN